MVGCCGGLPRPATPSRRRSCRQRLCSMHHDHAACSVKADQEWLHSKGMSLQQAKLCATCATCARRVKHAHLLEAMQSVLENPNPVRRRLSGSRREVTNECSNSEEGVSAVEVRGAPVPGGHAPASPWSVSRGCARAELCLTSLFAFACPATDDGEAWE